MANKNSAHHRYTLASVVATLLYVIAAIIAIVLLINAYVDNDSQYANWYIAAGSAMLGGLCTLFGVLITVKAQHWNDQEKMKLAYKPEIFSPDQIVLDPAIKICFVPNNTAEGSIVYTRSVIIKNTSKCPFRISRLTMNETDYFPVGNSFIDIGALFCMRFNTNEKQSKILMELQSLDDHLYRYEIMIDDCQIPTSIKEVK